MTEMRDPIEIYRESLTAAQTPAEDRPPVIQRAEAWPYPDLTRVWVRVETSPFAAFPNLTLTLTGPDGEIVATMFLVEIRVPYQSVTLHLRRPPQAGARYKLTLELSRAEVTLDTRVVPFDLVFQEPG